jgi:hypothetical protein
MDDKIINFSKLDELDGHVQNDLSEIDRKTRRNVLTKYSAENPAKNIRKKKVKPVSFAISFELDEKIDKYCEKKYMKKSTFAVLALEEFLKKKLEEEDR